MTASQAPTLDRPISIFFDNLDTTKNIRIKFSMGYVMTVIASAFTAVDIHESTLLALFNRLKNRFADFYSSPWSKNGSYTEYRSNIKESGAGPLR